MKIKSIDLKNFKGVVAHNYLLNEKTMVSGANGVGKTTLIDAICWVFANCDSELSSLTVAPIGNELCETEVVITTEEGAFKKCQTRTPKGETYATRNNYYIDGIPMSEKEFNKSLEDNGFSKELFLATSIPNYFFKQTTDKKRELLIAMATVTDKEVAEELGFEDLAIDLKDVSVSDLKKKAKDNIKSFENHSGKNNVKINAKLDALSFLKLELQTLKATKKVMETVDRHYSEYFNLRKNVVQNIADCERTLNQIEKVEQERIKRCEEEINKHFAGIKFQLWESNQSGDIKPCCIPVIDGYKVGESANNARELLAKVSIMNGLADFYKVDYPMFIDNAECLDKTSLKAIKSNRQIILTKVTDTALNIK